MMPGKHGTARERFWRFVIEASDSACWVWIGVRIPSGYGQFRLRTGKMVLAHRMAYELMRGPIPDGLTIDHLCRNKACVNPAHLETVTQAENNRRSGPRSIPNVNAQKTVCLVGHPLSGDNVYRTMRGRHCKECQRRRNRAWIQRKREGANAS